MKIYIQGFKSIKEAQRVALGRKLTFLVGPNSSGKSAVMLALHKLQGDSPAYDFDPVLLHQISNSDERMSSTQSLGLEWTHKKKEFGCYATFCTDEVAEDIGNTSKIIFPLDTQEAFDKSKINDTSFRIFISNYINGELKYARGGTSEIGIDYNPKKLWTMLFSHPGFDTYLLNTKSGHSIEAPPVESSLSWLISTYTELLDKQLYMQSPTYDHESFIKESAKKSNEAKEVIEEYINLYLALASNLTLKWQPARIKVALALYKGTDRQKKLNAFENLNAQIRKYIKKVDESILTRYPGKKMSIRLVSADRTLPTPTDSFAIVKDDERYENIFHELMRISAINSWEIIDQEAFGGHTGKNSNQLTLINKALSENLFLDNGYSIQIESKLACTTGNWKSQEFIQYESKEFICRMRLLDSHGRELSFTDVGSGIGYVLPILIESFREVDNNAIVFLQQPELHLHPALQASLTDVLIEACSNKRIVAETHSEHMILRALKRIRQTSLKTLADPTLSLHPSDVAVNYFEPLPDGSTKIHHLRISDDGDFIDRWPNGFFSERDKELFDE